MTLFSLNSDLFPSLLLTSSFGSSQWNVGQGFPVLESSLEVREMVILNDEWYLGLCPEEQAEAMNFGKIKHEHFS